MTGGFGQYRGSQMIRSLLLVAILVIAAALAAPSSDSSANATPRKGSITVELVDAELVVANANDESKPALKQALTVGEKIKNEVTVAPNQQISVSFRLRNKATSKPVNVQQAFLTFTNLASGEIIHFVVPADKSKKLYSVNVNPSAFKNIAGKYSMHIIIGDVSISNSFDWDVATVNLQFDGQPEATKPSIFTRKPEINHIFRQPERRPPEIVSQTFTLLVLAPFVILLIGWLTVGINFGYFPRGLSALAALGFHICIGGVVAVYAMFFWELNLFETLKYLAIVVVGLVFFGHRTLRAVALQRLKSQ